MPCKHVVVIGLSMVGRSFGIFKTKHDEGERSCLIENSVRTTALEILETCQDMGPDLARS